MTAFILKIIASAIMLIDHIGAVFPSDTPAVFRDIGRIAFPIYAYMIAQGCKHTKDIKKYLLRLGIFALASELFFDLAFSYNREISFISFTNVFYTLFLGAACCMIYSSLKSKKRAWLFLLPVALIPLAVLSQFFIQDINSIITWDVIRAAFIIYTAAVLFLCGRLPEANPGKNVLPRRILALVIIIPLIMLADILDTDYGMTGVIFIILFYLAKPENRVFRTAAMTVAVFLQYAYPYIVPKVLEAYGFWLPGILPGSMSFRQNLNEFWFAMAAAPLVFFYNGKQGHKFKWAFYAFYPVHIAALAFIRSLIA